MLLSYSTLLILSFIVLARAHGGQAPIAEGSDWATRHMAAEHHVDNFDPGAFFSLHDFDSSGFWTPEEVRRMYGLDDESLKDHSTEAKDKAVMDVFKIFDQDYNGMIGRDEFLQLSREGVKLPDFGFGPGHHGDDEYEYEIHHFEQYHDENTKEEDLNHPEDIAHFKKHDMEADAEERLQWMDRMPIIMSNIPMKFRKTG
ncbi:MAG: hypothetical protein M1834_004199 [Cirrosporium novae-zelandiae]|nr:MAG: hypothetical protein M1834_004199 [Cirrosporium novae-zelandiae]